MKRIYSVAVIVLLLITGGNLSAGDNRPLSFAVFGDTRPAGPYPQPGMPGTKRIIEEINWIGPDFVFHTGDMIYCYGEPDQVVDQEFDQSLGLLSALRSSLYVVPGNHDYCGSRAIERFKDRFGKKEYYSFDYDKVHFIILNTEIPGEEGTIKGDQFEWLKKDLEEHQGSKAIFVFLHRPLFPKLRHHVPAGQLPDRLRHLEMSGLADEKRRDELADLFSQYKVTAVMCGHEHLYQRLEVKGVLYLIIGGGGAPFKVPVEEGGFLHYLIVTVKDQGVKMELMEPYHFNVEVAYSCDRNRVFGEAKIGNICRRGQTLSLKGLRFTLPAGNYEVTTDTIPSSKTGGAKRFNASIIKTEKNRADPAKIDVTVQVDSPSGRSLLLTVAPK